LESSLSQLDGVEETDMLEAFGESTAEVKIEDIHIEDVEEEIKIEDIEEDVKIEDIEEDIKIEDVEEDHDIKDVAQEVIEDKEDVQTVSNCTSNDLASLLSQLLNNKTIEITIKIKD
jgi:hypothetical protein